MRRRARPSARTTRTAPTAPCVPVTRDGARVPRSVPRAAGPVTGKGSCTSVEGGSERSTGSPGGPRDTPRAGWTRRCPPPTQAGDHGRAPACPRRAGRLQRDLRRSLLRPFRVAGGGLPRGARRDPLPGRGGRRAAGQRPLPGRPADRHDRRRGARAAAVPAAAGAGAPAVRGGLGPVRQRPGDLHGPRRGRRRSLLVDDRTPPRRRRRPPRHDDLLRLRHGLLVHGPDLDDLVPGAYRRGRPDVPGHRHRSRRRPRGRRGRVR